MLAVSVRLERFESISGWNAEIGEYLGLIQETKLSQRDVLDVGWKPSAALTGPDQPCLGVSETLDHK